MSKEAESGQTVTVCNMELMGDACTELLNIKDELMGAYEKAATLAADFTEDYEGEAKEEVELFLESLPLHLYRLSLFYEKMAQFVVMTLMSFTANDQTMADKLEG